MNMLDIYIMYITTKPPPLPQGDPGETPHYGIGTPLNMAMTLDTHTITYTHCSNTSLHTDTPIMLLPIQPNQLQGWQQNRQGTGEYILSMAL